MNPERKYPAAPGERGATGWRLPFLMITVIILVVIFLRMPPRPCQEPLTYRIGAVDARFGLSRHEFADSSRQAAAIWGKSISRELFREEPKGAIEINLVYDYRQEAVDTLKTLSYKIDNTQSSYGDLKYSLETMKAEYDQKKILFASDQNAYNARAAALNAEIESGRQQRGAPEHIYRRLMTEKDELKIVWENLQVRQEELKKMIDTMNSMMVVINEIATNHNLDLVNYRDVGDKLGREFCEGNYTRQGVKQTITIYQYGSTNRLVRLLTHELGHALGLNHNDNPGAVMYRLNQSDLPELAPEDVAALKMRCNSN